MRFEVALLPNATSVNFKTLVDNENKKRSAEIVLSNVSSEVANNTDDTTVLVSKDGKLVKNEDPSSVINPAAPSRYNIIERLEQKYGHRGRNDTIEAPGDENSDYYSEPNSSDAELYDSEDSFIDDSELYETVEHKVFGHVNETKHQGFFVHAGDSIETTKIPGKSLKQLEKKSTTSGGAVKKRKRKVSKEPKKVSASKSAIQEFMSEWGPQGLVWKGDEKVELAIAELKEQATLLFNKQSPGRNFPRVLDDALEKVDSLVTASHAQGWRVPQYFARLMHFLPFTKVALVNNMKRLKLKAVARVIKTRLDSEIETMKSHVPEKESLSREGVEVVLESPAFGYSLSCVMNTLEEWIPAANEYRRVLKAPDKQMLEEADKVALTRAKEKTKMYNMIVNLFPFDAVEVERLKKLHKKNPKKEEEDKSTSVEKKGTKRKNASSSPAKSASGASPAVKKKKTTKKKASVASPAKKAAASPAKKKTATSLVKKKTAASSSPVKKKKKAAKSPSVSSTATSAVTKASKKKGVATKAIKTRRFVPCPPYSAADFLKK